MHTHKHTYMYAYKSMHVFTFTHIHISPYKLTYKTHYINSLERFILELLVQSDYNTHIDRQALKYTEHPHIP